MGFCALCQCLNQSVTPARSTFPAPRPLPALNPSTCVPCTDIQMRADNTRDLHVSVIAWICHTSQTGGLPPRPAEPVVREGEGAASVCSGRGVLLGQSTLPGGFPTLVGWAGTRGWMGLSRLTGEGGTCSSCAGKENKRQAILHHLGQALGWVRDVLCAISYHLGPRGSLPAPPPPPGPRLCSTSLHPGSTWAAAPRCTSKRGEGWETIPELEKMHLLDTLWTPLRYLLGCTR